jgi:hypothetical protein
VADNFAVTAGTGTTIAADDISSVYYQRIKVGIGADGAAVDWSDAAPAPVKTVSVSTTATLTRPSDTTTYAANDEVSSSTSAPTILSFTGCARANGGTGAIVSARCVSSNPAALPGTFELWLFDATNTPTNDNSAAAPSDAEAATVVAIIPFTASYLTANNQLYSAGSCYYKFKCASAATTLYGRVVVRNAYVPASGETLQFFLLIEQD